MKAAGEPPKGHDATRAPSVAVVVTTYNQARFLPDSLGSLLAQTRAPDRIVLVDAGSDDDPASVAAGYSVQFIRLGRVGVSVARNTGAEAVDTDLILFLDADDRLTPRALEAGVEAFTRTPDCAFVSGGHRQVDAILRPITDDLRPADRLDYHDFLRRNSVGMHATVLYRRQLLLDAGGFEPGLAASEDYDVFLRLSRQHPVASYGEVVAEYRKHGANTSNRAWLMLTRVLKVHARQRPYAAADPALMRAWRGGRSYWAGYYLRQLAREWRDRCMRRRPAPDPAFGVRECT